MGGSTGKGGGGNSGANLLQNTVNDLSAESKPIRDILSTQFQEALTTGGAPGAQLPLIGKMMEQSRLGTANAVRGTTEGLAASGLSRTPFAQSILADTRLRGESATSLIPSQVAQGFISGAPSYAMAPVGAMIGGAGTLANNQASRDIAKGQQSTDLYTSMFKAAASSAASACWIARRLYGADSCDAMLARYFIFERWQGRLADAVRWLYLRYGERVSRWRGVGVLRPLFDIAVRKALA